MYINIYHTITIMDQLNRLTESISKHMEIFVALLVQRKLTIFILSSDFLTDCLFVCLFVGLNHFGNCSLCFISTNCNKISTHSEGSVLLVQ